MRTSTFTTQSRTTIPKKVRDALDLHGGDELTWTINDDCVAVTTRLKHGPPMRCSQSSKGGST